MGASLPLGGAHGAAAALCVGRTNQRSGCGGQGAAALTVRRLRLAPAMMSTPLQRTKAACRIQAAWRGYLQRKKFARMDPERAKREAVREHAALLACLRAATGLAHLPPPLTWVGSRPKRPRATRRRAAARCHTAPCARARLQASHHIQKAFKDIISQAQAQHAKAVAASLRGDAPPPPPPSSSATAAHDPVALRHSSASVLLGSPEKAALLTGAVPSPAAAAGSLPAALPPGQDVRDQNTMSGKRCVRAGVGVWAACDAAAQKDAGCSLAQGVARPTFDGFVVFMGQVRRAQEAGGGARAGLQGAGAAPPARRLHRGRAAQGTRAPPPPPPPPLLWHTLLPNRCTRGTASRSTCARAGSGETQAAAWRRGAAARDDRVCDTVGAAHWRAYCMAQELQHEYRASQADRLQAVRARAQQVVVLETLAAALDTGGLRPLAELVDPDPVDFPRPARGSERWVRRAPLCVCAAPAASCGVGQGEEGRGVRAWVVWSGG